MDPVIAASQVVLGLQTVVSRQLNISKEPAVITIGSIHGGTRYNIIPDNVELLGTLRTFDEEIPLDSLRLWLALFAAVMFILCFTPAPIEPFRLLE